MTSGGHVLSKSIQEILQEGRAIWELEDNLPLPVIISCIGVIYGDICRQYRSGNPDYDELKKEFGNMIRWCDDMDFSPDECVDAAIDCQKAFVAKENS
jgi:hypothetical protein